MGDCHKCSLQEKEVAALEQLVGRYQYELQASASCCVCGRRAHQTLSVIEEELFENQRLDTLHWSNSESAAPQFARRNGQRCDFDQIALPSSEWVWTSDWHIDVGSKTDENGWTYASSFQSIAKGKDCSSDRMVGHRTRRRRWKRERKFIGSTDLPRTVSVTLESEAHLCALQNANKKLTEQLRRANDRILEYEDRLRAYEIKLLEMQHAQLPSKRPSRIITALKHESTSASAAPFSPSKSHEVLHQSEALLSQILGPAPAVLDEQMVEAQRRRAEIVMECQSELDGAVSEFHALVQTLDDPRRATSAPTQGA